MKIETLSSKFWQQIAHLKYFSDLRIKNGNVYYYFENEFNVWNKKILVKSWAFKWLQMKPAKKLKL